MGADAGVLISLDLGIRLGWAEGRPGEEPESRAILLGKKGGSHDIVFSAMQKLLVRRLRKGDVALVAKEAPLLLAAFSMKGSSQEAVRLAYGYHAVVEATCTTLGVPWVEGWRSTIMKHFVGRGDFKRAEGKAECLKRCHILGYLPWEIEDEDRADALAVFDWAAAVHMRKPQRFALFPDTRRAKK